MAQRLHTDEHGTYEERFGWRDPTNYKFKPHKGLNRADVEEISFLKSEAEWMRKFRLKAYERYERRPMPKWMAPDLMQIDLDDIYYFMRATDRPERDWQDVPPDIKKTFDRLGIPEAEQKYLGGVSAQYECVTGDTRVWTVQGLRPITELAAGDTVFALDESSQEIVAAQVAGQRCSGTKEVFQIRAGGRAISASANHPFLVLRQHGTKWLPLEHLRAGDLVAIAEGAPPAAAGGVATRTRVLFEHVDAITPVGTEPVYDIEVAGHHNFVAEGFVVHNSETVYHKVKDSLSEKGVIFEDMDSAVKNHPELVRKYFATVIPPNDNKLAALNSAVWSGGSFIYVPPGVQVDVPLQAYFRINAENMGQFERTLIIADEGSYVHYVEGCLPSGELVSSADGDVVPIEQISVGDHVLTHLGRPERVNAVQARDYRGPLYAFTSASRDNTFRVTAEHPLLIARRGKTDAPSWVEARDVRKGDYLVFPKPRPAPATTVLSLELSRLFGHYLASGQAVLVDGAKALLFTFSSHDHDRIDEVRRLCKQLYDAEGSVLWNDDSDESRVLVHTVLGYEAMRVHVGTLEPTRRLSEDVFRQDEDFLRALVDAWTGGAKRIPVEARTLARQLQAVLARLGTFSTVAPGETGLVVDRSRRPSVRDAGEHFLVPITGVDVAEYDGLVHNLDVREPDSYLAGGFAVHNCTAPVYSSNSLHSAVVELIALPHSRIRYTTIQNWAGNVYNLVTKRAVAHEEAVVEWVDGNLGCLAQGSRVTTPGGSKPIELLIPGDEVLSHDEATGELVWRRVLAKRFSGRQQVREVRAGARRLRVTGNHPFYSYSYDPDRARKLGRYSLTYKRADELSRAIVPRTSIDYGHPYKLERPSESTSFETGNQYAQGLEATRSRARRLTVGAHTDDDLMWLFGLFTGDGSIDGPEAAFGGRRWAKVTFATPVGDRARDRLMRVMANILPGVEPTARADGIALTWNSVELAEVLERNGFHTGARRKRVPEWVLDLPESQRLAFVAGYLDADGCAARGRRRFSLKSVNEDLLRDVADVLTSLGVCANLYTEHDDERPVRILGYDSVSRGAYVLEFRTDERLLGHVSPGLRDAVAAQSPARLRSHRTVGRSNIVLPESVEIRKVVVGEPLDVVPTWDIEVEGTGNFVAEGFIVHNSKVTVKYPAVVLKGRKAHGEVLSLAMAGRGQHQDTGAKMTHAAPETTSTIVSKSISRDGGITSYRGGVWIHPGAYRSKSNVRCDALLLDEESVSNTFPYMDIREDDVDMGHEATVARIGDEQLFYLMSRGIPEAEAAAMIVRGFIEPITKQLPMEYAVELNRLIELQMEGSVG